MTFRIRHPGWLLLPVCLSAVLCFVIACRGGSEAGPMDGCPPLRSHPHAEEGARGFLDLLDDHASFVQNELPGWQLRQVYIPWASEPVGFLYAPTPSKGTPVTYVMRDNLGQWQVTRDERTTLPEDLPLLELTDLRMGPETVVEIFEEQVPGVETGGLSIVREDCGLRWLAGGWQKDGEGRPRVAVSGVVMDGTGEFELTDRYELPGPR